MSSKPHELVFHGLREALSFSFRGLEKLKDKYIWSKSEVEEARGYLIYFRDTIKKENEPLFHALFGESGDFFELEPFARGYNSKVLSFKTIIDSKVKKWVIKVGFRISPVVDFGDPSTEGYFEEYQSYLDLLRKVVADRPILSHLLPEPQAISFATLSSDEHGKIGTTLAIQPFMHVVRPGDLKKTITKEEKLQLLSELRSFKELSAHLMDTYQIRPELIGEGNLEIVRFGEDYHLMLLDMGWVDLKKPLPITQTIAHFSAQYVIGKLENWLKNKVGE
ncbi:MAG TPA: hypothetical protein VN711_04185 [Candidatus Saccharimonadales bacterium]|nr:hypothetical protein [Candidatus Saccharimonadales bacterium]